MTHTPRTLAKYDGERILLAIAGTALGVIAGRGFTAQVSAPTVTAKMTHGLSRWDEWEFLGSDGTTII